MLKETNPLDAVKEDLSVSYITQLTADAGVNFQEHRKDYMGVDGAVEFFEAPLRIQLKSTTQSEMWADSFEFYLREGWLEKWKHSLVPVVLVLLVINSKTDTNGARLPFVKHGCDDYQVNGRGYWVRVDELAKNHDFEKSKGLSITLNSTHRIDEQSVIEWYELATSMFREGSAT